MSIIIIHDDHTFYHPIIIINYQVDRTYVMFLKASDLKSSKLKSFREKKLSFEFKPFFQSFTCKLVKFNQKTEWGRQTQTNKLAG